MKILVPIKRAASLDDEFEMRDDGRDVDPDFCEFDINEFDEYSVEEAIKIKEAAGDGVEVVVATVGPTMPTRSCARHWPRAPIVASGCGTDAIEDSDPIAIARILSQDRRAGKAPTWCWPARNPPITASP